MFFPPLFALAPYLALGVHPCGVQEGHRSIDLGRAELYADTRTTGKYARENVIKLRPPGIANSTLRPHSRRIDVASTAHLEVLGWDAVDARLESAPLRHPRQDPQRRDHRNHVLATCQLRWKHDERKRGKGGGKGGRVRRRSRLGWRVETRKRKHKQTNMQTNRMDQTYEVDHRRQRDVRSECGDVVRSEGIP